MSKKRQKKTEKKKIQSPIKLKNSEKIKNDHISSSDARIKLGKENGSAISTPVINSNIKKIENILDLPQDMLLRIISFVSLEDLPKVALLCRRFKLLVYNDIIYEQKLHILGLKYISTEQWIAMNKINTQKTQKGKHKHKKSELKNMSDNNFLPPLDASNVTSHYSSSLMKLNELNDYLHPTTGKIV